MKKKYPWWRHYKKHEGKTTAQRQREARDKLERLKLIKAVAENTTAVDGFHDTSQSKS